MADKNLEEPKIVYVGMGKGRFIHSFTRGSLQFELEESYPAGQIGMPLRTSYIARISGHVFKIDPDDRAETIEARRLRVAGVAYGVYSSHADISEMMSELMEARDLRKIA